MFLSALIVAIEGPDRVGKKTQTKLLVDRLETRDYKVATFEIPKTSLVTYNLIYWMLNNGLAKKFPNIFQTIQFLNKFMFQFKLLFLRWTYDVIVLDRWSLSSIIYGDETGANKSYVRFLYWFLREPDVTIVLNGPSPSKEELNDSYERDDSLQKRVRKGYIRWCVENNHKPFELVDNEGNRQEVHDRIMRILDSRYYL